MTFLPLKTKEWGALEGPEKGFGDQQVGLQLVQNNPIRERIQSQGFLSLTAHPLRSSDRCAITAQGTRRPPASLQTSFGHTPNMFTTFWWTGHNKSTWCFCLSRSLSPQTGEAILQPCPKGSPVLTIVEGISKEPSSAPLLQ